jgi:predicted O-methyltransferase YrrM
MSYAFSFDWFTHNANNFLAVKNILPARQDMLEIGSFEGRSMVWIAKNMLEDGGTLVCIDTWLGGVEHRTVGMDLNVIEERFDHNLELLEIEEPNKTVIKKKGRSSEMVASLIDSPKFDLIYVDGSHEAADCLSDAVMCWEVLKPGGVMIFDDYGWNDRPVGPLHPKPAVDAFINFFHKDLTVLYMNYQVAVQKKT